MPKLIKVSFEFDDGTEVFYDGECVLKWDKDAWFRHVQKALLMHDCVEEAADRLFMEHVIKAAEELGLDPDKISKLKSYSKES